LWDIYLCFINNTLKQRDVRRLKTAEMKFMRCKAGHSLLSHIRNEDILKELKADPIKISAL
jgi:hypothetical protein